MTASAPPEDVRRIERQLQRGKRYFTLTDAAAMTGLSVDETRDALEALLTKYVCRLQVSENGDLIYHFGDVLRRRGEKSLAEHVAAFATVCWKLFTLVYKAWIALTLVVYFVAFLALLVVALVALSGRQSSERQRRRSAPLDLRMLGYLFADIFRWRTVTETLEQGRDRYGYRYRRYRPQPAVFNAGKKSFMASVYDFVFGPPRAARDPLANYQEVAAYLRQHQGLVTASDLSALAGWTLPQAETFLTECIIRFRGAGKVSDNAVLYGEFDEIVRSVGTANDGAVVYYWDEYEPDHELTGNSPTRNLVIGLMNGFNLLLALLVVRGSFAWLFAAQYTDPSLAFLPAYGPFIEIVLGWVPLVFSLLFFVIPLVRLLRLQALRRQQHAQNIRKRLLKAIFTVQGQPQTLPEIQAAVNTAAEAEFLSPQVIEDTMKTLALDLEGDMQVTETAQVQFSFPRMQRELQEMHALRRHRRVDGGLGEIIADSH
jgi:hypothetical protein